MKNLLNKFAKKAVLLTVSAAVLVSLTSCKDSDVVAGVIVGGVIGGIVAGGNVTVGVGSPRYTFLSDCEGWRREWVCEWSQGGWYRSYRRHHWNIESTWSAQSQAVTVDAKAQAISTRWGLKEKAASKLSEAIEAAKGGERNAFNKIGLSLQDLGHLISKNQIDINDLDRVANSLNTTPETALAILNAFTAEYRAQEKDVNGALWRQCVSQGNWKTPQVAACSSLEAAGCAPATGASSCLPL